MIRFDFETYVNKFIDVEEYSALYSQKETYIQKLRSSNMSGWTKPVSQDVLDDINNTAKYIKDTYECLVVIGIGGSFLGSYAFDKMFRSYFNDKKFEIIYAGTTLSSKYLDELLDYLKDKNFCINVISKSGTTMETSVTYKLLKDLIKRKYPTDVTNRIIVTTDKEKGTLRQEVNEQGYKSFIIPDDIGGRYSFITPAHLLPLAINYNLKDIVDGYFDGKRFVDKAFEYAVKRYLLFKNNKLIENFCIYEENMSYFTEWLKQLFGETEGKNGVGIYPTSSVHTRDLHSLGQFVQEGNKILFETFIKIDKSKNYIDYNGKELHDINNIVEDSVMKAHYIGNVPCLEINLSSLNIDEISQLIYFFMLAAAFSGYLFGVDPFNQQGVEVYKKEVKESLNNI